MVTPDEGWPTCEEANSPPSTRLAESWQTTGWEWPNFIRRSARARTADHRRLIRDDDLASERYSAHELEDFGYLLKGGPGADGHLGRARTRMAGGTVYCPREAVPTRPGNRDRYSSATRLNAQAASGTRSGSVFSGTRPIETGQIEQSRR